VIATLKSGVPPPPNGGLGLPPLEIYSTSDREAAVKRCLENPGNILAVMQEDLYLGRKPSESELEIMNLKTVRK
jgi:hypothetical protein